MIYRIIIIIIIINSLSTANLFSQEKKYNLSLGSRSFIFYNVLDYGKHTLPIDLFSLDLQRRFSDKIFITIGYNIPSGLIIGEFSMTMLTYENHPTKMSIDKIETRHEYHYFDLTLGYVLYKSYRSKFSVNIGPSYTFGTNSYLRILVLAPPPPFGMGDFIYKKNEKVTEGYFGGKTSLSYDYYLSSKFNIGADLISRYYLGGFPYSIHYGLHFGYNF